MKKMHYDRVAGKSVKVIKNYNWYKCKYRAEATNWQCNILPNHSFYWSELKEKYDYFYKIGKRYGLLREFKENGII